MAVGRSHSEPTDVRKIGDIKRRGAWVVPAECRFRSYFGAVIVDLRDATITAQELRIDARTPFGNIVAPRIILTGGTWFGDVKILHQRRHPGDVTRMG